ncbi:uncharacterized protein BX664DRAFT_286901 [Halteromyces radiatus]|uniref:uncharacterized protein n=1 Tax=Halteromyces radiatus TaxID=101107 RepID=UPI002220691A|nr:uncharacterized protein BX664DRAFT_286901 [Halteromyces radiatus]KAI8078769.1 hypothetical protein BX664DRAFT_286901 [Halteromyces radiatus]
MAKLQVKVKDAPNRPFVFCFYVSGHGWGHATRANQIISDILRLQAQHQVYVISNASSFIFQGVTKVGAIYRQANIDAGVVQPLAYTVDRQQTIKNLRQFIDQRSNILLNEVAWLKQVQADCVICDAPFLPCAAAAGAGIPAAIASNFTFDEVYTGLCEGDALDEEIRQLVNVVIQDYRTADLLIRLPGAIRIPSFDDAVELVPSTPVLCNSKGIVNGKTQLPSHSVATVLSSRLSSKIERRIIDIPLVFRKYHKERKQVLDELGIPCSIYDTHQILLLSFGGQVLGQEWKHENPLPPQWICIVCGAPDNIDLPPGFYRASRDAYVPDLTNAVDVVLGKLGYGTCSECIGHHTPFVYVPRPQFIEEYGLRKLMQDQGSAVELHRDDFEAGKWADAIQQASKLSGACDEPDRLVGHNGGQVAAKTLEQFVIEWNSKKNQHNIHQKQTTTQNSVTMPTRLDN